VNCSSRSTQNLPSHEAEPGLYSDWGDPRQYSIGDIGIGECAGEVVSRYQFEMTAAERLVFEAGLDLDRGAAQSAGETAYAAFIRAAKALGAGAVRRRLQRSGRDRGRNSRSASSTPAVPRSVRRAEVRQLPLRRPRRARREVHGRHRAPPDRRSAALHRGGARLLQQDPVGAGCPSPPEAWPPPADGTPTFDRQNPGRRPAGHRSRQRSSTSFTSWVAAQSVPGVLLSTSPNCCTCPRARASSPSATRRISPSTTPAGSGASSTAARPPCRAPTPNAWRRPSRKPRPGGAWLEEGLPGSLKFSRTEFELDRQRPRDRAQHPRRPMPRRFPGSSSFASYLASSFQFVRHDGDPRGRFGITAKGSRLSLSPPDLLDLGSERRRAAYP
jgi:hypothetical protein